MSELHTTAVNGEINTPPIQNNLTQSYYSRIADLPPTVEPFKADRTDGIFALFAFVLGYFFCRWVLVSAQGWGTAVFTVAYLAATLTYLLKKGVQFSKESWFWFAVTLLTGLSFALWDNNGILPLRNLFLFCAAVYWIVSATAIQISGKTGNYLLLDGINAVLIIPFRNFINQYRALGTLRSSKPVGKRKALPIIIGIIAALIILLVVTPQLLAADSGGFTSLLNGFLKLFSFDISIILEFLLYGILAVPTAAYLFGLLSGSTARRGINAFSAAKTQTAVSVLRVAPPSTINIVLGTVSALYVVFIACQIPYFFSAFSGSRPAGWLSYSDYARQGFFELCRLATINLLLLTSANILSRKPRRENTVLKTFNIVISFITLILLATAASKMVLYISAFGLTILRILPCVFMALLAIVCIAVIVLQKSQFSILRVTLIAGAVLFTALCLSNIDANIVRYNTSRYLAGTLSDYDITVLERSGAAGVPSAVDMYNASSDPALKYEIETYLLAEKERILLYKDTFRDTLQNVQAWEEIRAMELD